MVSQNVFSFIKFDEYEATPKYIQLANSVLKAIQAGQIFKGYWLPSINELSYELDISRDTADRVYRRLRKLGIVRSIPGKGNYISSVSIVPPFRIYILFDKLSSHKKIIYDAFVAAMGEHAIIDFFIYNNDTALFKKLLKERRGEYSDYVIIPPIIGPDDDVAAVLKHLPTHNLLLLRQFIPGVAEQYAAVYEDFKNDIFTALEQALDRLSNYHTIKLILPGDSFYPEEIAAGFTSFCTQYAFDYEIIADTNSMRLHTGEVYICVAEDNLVLLVQQLLETRLKVGKDVGIISYNETPLKKFILNGITTISADFHNMGEVAANLILNKTKAFVRAPFHLTLRNSL
jgi:DNA-binding transcriptional regulator YhcF (GntR family)